MKQRWGRSVLAIGILLCFLLGGCRLRTTGRDDFRIVTSFYPLYITALNLTEGIDGISVENMAGQHAGCLHDYQLQNSDMKNLESADVFVINGLHMESFLEKVTEQLPSLQMVEASGGIVPITEDGEENPHVWVSVSGCMQQVETVADGLAAADPAHAVQYAENAEAYLAKLASLREEMHAALDPLSNRKIVTMHEAFPYFAQEFALTIVGVINREPDSQPSAKEIVETIDIVRSLDVKAVFAEPQYDTSAAQLVAQESGATVYTLDPVVTGEETPDAYLDAMRGNLETLKLALQ